MIAAKLTSNFDIAAMPKAALRRVRVDDIVVAPKLSEDPLVLCLDLWKTWMQGDPDRDLGASTMRGLMGDGDGRGVDSSEAQQVQDMKIAAATDAMINSLARIHVWAIYKSCSISNVWRFPSANFIEAAEVARAELKKKLRKNICTSILF